MKSNQEKIFLTPKELAKRWNKSIQTLANNRSLKKGISYHLIDGQIRYDIDDIEAYENKNKVIL